MNEHHCVLSEKQVESSYFWINSHNWWRWHHRLVVRDGCVSVCPFLLEEVACIRAAWRAWVQMQWRSCSVFFTERSTRAPDLWSEMTLTQGVCVPISYPVGRITSFLSAAFLSLPVVDLDQTEGFVLDWKCKINSHVCRHSFTHGARNIASKMTEANFNNERPQFHTLHCEEFNRYNHTVVAQFKKTASRTLYPWFLTFTHCCCISQPGLLLFFVIYHIE